MVRDGTAARPPEWADPLRWLLFGVGLAASCAMAWRAQVELDQYVLLVRGWLWAREGWLVPFGALTAAGGFQPGPLTSLTMGVPLTIWADYRAVGFFTVLTHVAAYVLFDRVIRDVFGWRGRLILGVVYWLNPWRVFYSAHAWNPNLVFLPAAVHLWSAFRLRVQPGFLASFLHVVALGAAFQLHASFLIPALVSVALVAGRKIRLHPGGVTAGLAAVGVSLIGWLQAVVRHPGLLPLDQGALGGGLLRGLPVVEGVAYWLRYPTAAGSSKMTRFDFVPALGEAWDGILGPVLTVLPHVVGATGLLVVLTANVWMWRRRRPGPAGRSEGLDWLLGYARWTLLAFLAVFAMNPVTESTSGTWAGGTTSWRGFISLHAAALPAVAWLALAWRSPRGRRWRIGLACYAGAVSVLLAAMAIAAPMYRKGGEQHLSSVLRGAHPMHVELGIREGATLVIDAERGFDADLLDGPRALDRSPPYPRM